MEREIINSRPQVLGGGDMRKTPILVATLLASVMIGSVVQGATYTSWLQFQFDKGHSGTIVNANFGPGSDISNPDELIGFQNCESLASPAAWSEERQNPGGAPVRLEFAVWAAANCVAAQNALEIRWGSWNFANPPASTSPWDHLSASFQLGVRNGESLSASPAVFFIDNDATLDTTRIVSVSNQGLLNIHSLTWAGLNPTVAAVREFPAVGATEDIDVSNSYDFLSPVIYENPFWGDGPDAGAALDDFAYVARELQGLGQNHDVSIRSYDLHTAGNPAGIPRYDSQVLQGRKLTMATPAIIYQKAQGIIIGPGAPQDIVEHPWDPPVNPGDDPISLEPPWGPPYTWPPGFPWQPVPGAALAYLLVATTDMNGANAQVDAFSLNPNNLVGGQYPHVWTLALTSPSNGAITGIDLHWVVQPGGQLKQEPIAVVVQDDGKALFIEDPFTNPPAKAVTWTLDITGQNYIRASATKVDQLLVFPWESQNWFGGFAGQFIMSWVDTTVAVNPIPVPTFAIWQFELKLSHNAARITPSGIFDKNNGYYNGMNNFYIGVECQPVPPGGPLCAGAAPPPEAGLYKILKISIVNQCGNCGSFMPMPGFPNDKNWHIWGTPALVGDTDSGSNYLFLPQQRPCQPQMGGGCPANPAVGGLTSYWG